MTPESLVLQPKVTEVRWTEQTGLWTQGSPQSRQQKRCTLTGGLVSAGWAPAVVLHPSGLPSDESACLSCLLIYGADTLKWHHRGPTNLPPHSVKLADMLAYINISRTTSATHFRAAPSSRLPSIKDMIH